MPRGPRRTTQSGDPAQPMTTNMPGRPYGAGVEQERAERAMPAPQVADMQSRPPSLQSALELARQYDMPPPSPLDAPSNRPGEPVTSGLPIGPGPGPEALVYNRARARRTQVLDALAQDIRSPRLARLAARARRGL